MEKLVEVLNDIDETVNWTEEKALINNHILDSFGIITLISEMEDTFDIEIDASEIIPENFNSVQAMSSMIQRLQEK